MHQQRSIITQEIFEICLLTTFNVIFEASQANPWLV